MVVEPPCVPTCNLQPSSNGGRKGPTFGQPELRPNCVQLCATGSRRLVATLFVARPAAVVLRDVCGERCGRTLRLLQPRCLHTLLPINPHPRCLYAVMIHRRHPHMLFVKVSISLLMTELSRKPLCTGGGARQEFDPLDLSVVETAGTEWIEFSQGRCAASRTVKLTPSRRPHPATPPLPFPTPSLTPGACFAG